MNRRRLIRQAGAALATIAMTGGAWRAACTGSASWLVLIRQTAGIVAVDPRSGREASVDANVPIAAALAARMVDTGNASVAMTGHESFGPDAIVSLPGTIAYRMRTPDGDAGIVRLVSDDVAAWWYWRVGERPGKLTLPPNLDPAYTSGSVGRWFHGASITRASLDSGKLRLMAVDLEHGTVVLDQVLGRRLELAATAISDDGALIAHVQGGNTGVEVWAADLRRNRQHTWPVEVGPLPLAPDLIDLRLASDATGGVLACGLAWADFAHHEPVALLGTLKADTLFTIPGTLVGIVPRACVVGVIQQPRTSCLRAP